MTYRLRIVFLLLSFSSFSFAQNNFGIPSPAIKKPGIIGNIENDFNSVLSVGWDFFKSPLSYDTQDFLLAGALIGATSLSLTVDTPIRNRVKKTRNNTLNDVTYYGEKFGNPKYGTALSGLLYASGLIINDKELRLTGLMLAEAMFLNGIITQGLKIGLGRPRPYLNEGSGHIEFLEFEFEGKDQSLPSGHTSTAFTIATILSKRIDNIYASAALYSFASLTAFQRIYDDKHWFSDTVLGAAIGTLVGLKIVKLHSKLNTEKQEGLKINFVPYYNGISTGLGASLIF
jgi:membrane-associated phospholipid phosphatase